MCTGFVGARSSGGVSILVFVELVLDVECNFSFPAIVIMFQSLFSWNLFLMCKKRIL